MELVPEEGMESSGRATRNTLDDMRAKKVGINVLHLGFKI